MKLSIIATMAIAGFLLAACAAKKPAEYKNSHSIPALQVPADLSMPVFNRSMEIPDIELSTDIVQSEDDDQSIEMPPVLVQE